jgi:transcriptional regulator with XRE-family HTH domain
VSPVSKRSRASEAGGDRSLRAASERMRLTREFGQTLRQRRLAVGMTPSRLAQRCRVSRATINKVESGITEPRLSLILILCDGLGITPDTLIGELPVPQERRNR